jgi:predicted nucleic acid-binding protein
LGDDALVEIAALAQQYQALRPQLADLTLLLLAEREKIDTIFTLDRRDFLAFGRRGHRHFHLLPESL